MTSGYDAIRAKLDNGATVILDGAIGTELERLGAPMHDAIWCGHAIETHPDLITEVHRSYIAAGADVITANTYCTGRPALSLGGLEDRTEAWNRTAMQIARAACDEADRPVAIAGSVSTFGTWDNLPIEDLRVGFAEQARLLVDQGADLILLETLASAPATVMAAIEETAGLGVPVWAAISCMEDRETGILQHGVEESRESDAAAGRAYAPFADVVEEIARRGLDAILMMHSDLSTALPAVKALKAHGGDVIGLYPNAGYWLRPQWAFVDQVEPEEYARRAKEWVAAGARIVGGCCGVGPPQIAAAAAALARNDHA